MYRIALRQNLFELIPQGVIKVSNILAMVFIQRQGL